MSAGEGSGAAGAAQGGCTDPRGKKVPGRKTESRKSFAAVFAMGDIQGGRQCKFPRGKIL